MTERFDLLIVGAGSGNNIPDAALERGQTVAIVEPYRFGGTCLNRGCIPSKMLIHSAEVAHTVRNAASFGIQADLEGVNWEVVQDRVWSKLRPMSDGSIEWSSSQPGFKVFTGDGKFVDDRVLEVNGERITADTIVISCGGRPTVPEIPGIHETPYITSNEALMLKELPESMIVLGGGYIGAELAHLFGSLGTEVTIVDMLPALLHGEDDDVREQFTKDCGRRFDLVLGAKVSQASATNGLVSLDLSVGEEDRTISAEKLLLAVGRRPNSDVVHVERTGVETTHSGHVRVDPYMRTTAPGIWALGDVVDTQPFKHVANHEARVVMHNIYHPDDLIAADHYAVPHAVFANPQVAGVGLTEREAEDRGIPYKVAVNHYRGTAYGFAVADEEGFAKILAHRGNGQIIGAHVIGPQASILIQQLVQAVKLRLTVDQLKRVMYIHPSAPELIEGAIGNL